MGSSSPIPLLEFSWEPGLASVVAAEFDDATRELLDVEPKVFSILPLQHGKVVARSNALNDIGAAPGSGVFGVNDATLEIAIVDLELYVAEGDSTEGRASRYFPGVEYAFEEFRLKSTG